MAKITLKSVGLEMHDVYQDGVKVATFWFSRNRRDAMGRVNVHTSGQLTTVDGRS